VSHRPCVIAVLYEDVTPGQTLIPGSRSILRRFAPVVDLQSFAKASSNAFTCGFLHFVSESKNLTHLEYMSCLACFPPVSLSPIRQCEAIGRPNITLRFPFQESHSCFTGSELKFHVDEPVKRELYSLKSCTWFCGRIFSYSLF
jgi:hypothetical protein